jgi:hypothetical protein
MEEMYRRYRKRKEQEALAKTVRVTRSSIKQNIKCIGRSMYLELVRTLTGNSEKITRTVDYVTDILVNERMNTLHKIISDLVAPTQKAQMHQSLAIVQNFLKYQYDEHVRKDDEVSTGLKA